MRFIRIVIKEIDNLLGVDGDQAMVGVKKRYHSSAIIPELFSVDRKEERVNSIESVDEKFLNDIVELVTRMETNFHLKNRVHQYQFQIQGHS